jgi:hypothetical protein
MRSRPLRKALTGSELKPQRATKQVEKNSISLL